MPGPEDDCHLFSRENKECAGLPERAGVEGKAVVVSVGYGG